MLMGRLLMPVSVTAGTHQSKVFALLETEAGFGMTEIRVSPLRGTVVFIVLIVHRSAC